MKKPSRTLVIGDLHGGFRALLQVLERCSYDSEQDKLIFLGDYVDGYSQSAQVIQYLIELEEKAVHKPIFLRGNHDKWCEDWLWMGQTPMIWTQQGGQSTIDSYIKTSHIISEKHKKFFKNLLNYYVDEDNRGFVHGGFRSRKGLGHEVYQADYYWDRDLWNIALMSHGRVHLDSEGTPQGRRFLKHKEVFIGHTSTLNWNVKRKYPEYILEGQAINGAITVPMNRCNVWNLDTGGGFKGKLTAMDIDTKEFWQSDLLSDLYPDEKGR